MSHSGIQPSFFHAADKASPQMNLRFSLIRARATARMPISPQDNVRELEKMVLASLTPDGRALGPRRGLYPAALVLSLVWATPALAQPDFNGTWQVAKSNDVIRPDWDEANLTDAAKARLKAYETRFVANGVETGAVCYPPGMPWMMLSQARNYVYDIYQTPGRIVVTYEPMDQFRQIYLDGRKFPDNISPSRQGYSIGRFEGDVLKIETRGLAQTNDKAVLYQRGADAVVYEEWKLEKDSAVGELLTIKVTVNDPEIFKAPGHGGNWLKRAEPGASASGYNCPEGLWDDLVEETLGKTAK